MHSPTAILFDIDGTLIRGASTLHLACMADALHTVTGRRPRLHRAGSTYHVDGQSIMGRTDRGVFQVMLGEDGPERSVIDALTAAFVARYHEQATRDPQQVGTPVAGIHELLDTLTGQRIPVGLVTGNHHLVARTKLGAVGLDGPFTFRANGGFGSDTDDRAELARRALGLLGVEAGPQVWLVGDTARDIDAARSCNLTAVAVASDDHAELQPDHVVDDHHALAELLLASA